MSEETDLQEDREMLTRREWERLEATVGLRMAARFTLVDNRKRDIDKKIREALTRLQYVAGFLRLIDTAEYAPLVPGEAGLTTEYHALMQAIGLLQSIDAGSK